MLAALAFISLAAARPQWGEMEEEVRRLGVDVDFAGLAHALHTGHDFGRVSAAEAILVLTSAIGRATPPASIGVPYIKE